MVLIMDSRKIAVFDSGVGSLSIIKELKTYLPNEDILYLADRLHFPYGKKSQDELYNIVLKSLNFLERFDPKLIVMASNTPSVIILKKVKQKYPIPLVGISPPLRALVKNSITKKIGIMGTETTIKSPQLSQQVKKIIPDTFEVTKINASPIIDLVEDGTFLKSKTIIEKIIKEILDDLITNKKIDVVSLSSTHLPLVKRFFEKLYPDVIFIDQSESFAKKIKRWLIKKDLQNFGSNIPKLDVYVSKDKLEFSRIIRSIGLNGQMNINDNEKFF